MVTLYVSPPEGATIPSLDELGPVSPRTFPPAPGWSPDVHRINAPLDYSRGPDTVWVYGALRPGDGQALTFTAPSRNAAGFLTLLDAIDAANPVGELYLINDNLSSHASGPVREWLTAHSRVHQEPLPTGACWLNLIEGWRLFRRDAFAEQSFADHGEIETARHSPPPAQPSRQALDLGPSTAAPSCATVPFCLLALRNGAPGCYGQGDSNPHLHRSRGWRLG